MSDRQRGPNPVNAYRTPMTLEYFHLERYEELWVYGRTQFAFKALVMPSNSKQVSLVFEMPLVDERGNNLRVHGFQSADLDLDEPLKYASNKDPGEVAIITVTSFAKHDVSISIDLPEGWSAFKRGDPSADEDEDEG
jgi:hypothetical protein